MLCRVRNSTVVALTAASAVAIGFVGTSFAQAVEGERVEVGEVTFEEDRPRMIFGDGLAISAGGGVTNFVGDQMRDTTNVGGLWEVRLVVGTRSWLGAEAAYVGTAQSIDALIGNDDGTLVGTMFEGLARFNLVNNTDFTPYAVAGLGWAHYRVAGADFTTSSAGIANTDNLMTIPLGAGVAYAFSGLFADARFTFRPTFGADMVLEDPVSVAADDDFAEMHSWDVSARIGYQF